MSSYKDYTETAKRRRRNNAVLVLTMLLIIMALTIALAYVASRMLTGKPLFDPIHVAQPGSGTASDPALMQPEGTTKPDGLFGAQVPRIWNTMDRLPSALNKDVVSTDAKMLALPATGKVSRDYFRKALFIGDSLMQGMAIYNEGLLNEGTVVAAFKGTSPKMIVQNGTGELPDKTKVPMLEFIQKQAPDNIYVGMGTNAMLGEEDAAFLKYYGDLLDMLQQSFPGIPVYVQSITPVTAETSAKKPSLDNDRVRMLNNSLALMARERGMYYINLHEVLADADGCLRADVAANDGIHLWSTPNLGYQLWVDYLQTHTAYNPNNLQFLEAGQSYYA